MMPFTQSVELAGRFFKRLSEEVSEVIRGAHIRQFDLKGFNHVTHKEVTPLHMLHVVVMLRVVRDIACRCTIIP